MYVGHRFRLNHVVGLVLMALALLLTGCAAISRPDLQRLYARGADKPWPYPVVIVHGAFGARLRDRVSKQDQWPGGLTKILFSDYNDIALTFDPKTLAVQPSPLEAYKITSKVAGEDFYGRLIRTLEQDGGFRRTYVGTPISDWRRRFYIFHYDWRQDNVVSAQKLARFMAQIRADYGTADVRVDIIAHSMGGLITRYFLRYGDRDVLDQNDFKPDNAGARYVHQVVLVGTPSLGSVRALQNIIDGMSVGFGRIEPEVFATMPSSFELLPHPLNHWIVTTTGKVLDRDLFDVELWRRFQWSIFSPKVRARIEQRFDDPQAAQYFLQRFEKFFEKNLERARRFVWSLTVPLPAAHANLVVFGGDCRPTPARLLVEDVAGISYVRLFPRQIKHKVAGVDYQQLMLEPGDGSVTKASLLGKSETDPSRPRDKYSFFPLGHDIMFCDEHSQLTGNVTFQDNLLNILLRERN